MKLLMWIFCLILFLSQGEGEDTWQVGVRMVLDNKYQNLFLDYHPNQNASLNVYLQVFLNSVNLFFRDINPSLEFVLVEIYNMTPNESSTFLATKKSAEEYLYKLQELGITHNFPPDDLVFLLHPYQWPATNEFQTSFFDGFCNSRGYGFVQDDARTFSGVTMAARQFARLLSANADNIARCENSTYLMANNRYSQNEHTLSDCSKRNIQNKLEIIKNCSCLRMDLSRPVSSTYLPSDFLNETDTCSLNIENYTFCDLGTEHPKPFVINCSIACCKLPAAVIDPLPAVILAPDGTKSDQCKAECAALILADTCTDKNYYEMLLQIAPELEKSAPGELKSQRLPFLTHVISIGDTRKPGTITFDDLMTLATAEDHATMNSVSAKMQFDQDAFIQFSSGTTGQPKPARLSHFNVVNNANIVGRFVGFHEQHEIFCMNGQLIYGIGRTLGILIAPMFGATVVLPGPFFEPKSTMEAIANYRCTVAFGSPTIILDMMEELQHGDYNVSSLRKEKWKLITTTAGMSPPDWVVFGDIKLYNIAEPVKVVDSEGRIVPVNTSGELCTRGPHVFKGYLNDDAKTKEALRDGWYHTGDEGSMSEDGRITFSGRTKDMINTRSFKVPPLEVETILNTHPDVKEAQVIGVPDKRVVNKICVWIKLHPEKTLTPEDVKTFCKGKMHDYKIPEYVLFVDSFPRTQSGKVQKQKMREESVRLLNL